jgi:cyclopropane fatty-acyl-phospholipid synthase-like methyltransferase
MTDSEVWEELFDGHAPLYMENPFTKDSTREVAFLIEELDLEAGTRVLDIGCGTGRHAVELARHGCRVTGVDLSSGMLAEARSAAREAGVEIRWIHADATRFKAEESYDVALSLCEGAFGLLGRDSTGHEHELAILRNMNRALKPGGRALLTVLNGLSIIRRLTQADVESGKFDPLNLAETEEVELETPAGKVKRTVSERGFVPGELILMFERCGFRVLHLWGGTAGNWGQRPIELDEMEIMVVAEKIAEISGQEK